MNVKFLVLFVLLWTKFHGFAHDYHFAFMEIEYNSTDQQFQASLKVTAHDLAFITSKKHGQDVTMDQILRTDSLRLELEQRILEGFSLYQSTQQVYFKVDGYDLNKNGDLIFYLSSEEIARSGLLKIYFPLLTDYFPDQQNKVDFLKKGKHHILTFLLSDPSKELNISP